ncbi:hypothetical protein LCGC14_1036380 [marine sediment metagenome]|uniref:Uncharacterized protein n=1 Tax=marine sediment metagenome TaxID=412755 RepID=A0A0F9NEP8_9ZZZZ
MDNYTVVMTTRTRAETSWGSVRHLPTFLIGACSPQEAVSKVRSMFGEELRISGRVLRAEPHCDRRGVRRRVR